MSFEKILLALDLGSDGTEPTPGSRRALDQARSIATRDGSKLVVLHSTAADEHWDPDRGSYVHSASGAPDAARTALDHIMAELLQDGIEATLELPDEKAWLSIVRRVVADPVDLVVVGKRSHYVGHPSKLGSVTLKLMRQCPCPVWAVKEDITHELGHLVAATDLSHAGSEVLGQALSITREWGGVAHLVHSFQIPVDVQLHEDTDQFVRKTREACVAQVKARVAEMGVDFDRVRLHVAPDSPTHAILAVCERFAANLVVMGSIGRGGLPGILMGNTAERLLGKLDCSLLVVKPPNFVPPVKL